MNKKLKKALYMFGFVLPIVAIPIITVACGTQTSQVEPTPSPAPEKETEPKVETSEVIKPDLSILKETNISENILSEDIKSLLSNWKDNKFEIKEIKENKLFSKFIASHVDENSSKLKTILKYSDLIENISELNFVDIFNINSLSIKNLNNEKLKTLKLSEVISSNLEKLIEAVKSKSNETFAELNSEYDKEKDGIKQKIEELINKNSSSAFSKIKEDLKNEDKIDSNKFKKILEKFKFSDLIDIDKLQEKLTYTK